MKNDRYREMCVESSEKGLKRSRKKVKRHSTTGKGEGGTAALVVVVRLLVASSLSTTPTTVLAESTSRFRHNSTNTATTTVTTTSTTRRCIQIINFNDNERHLVWHELVWRNEGKRGSADHNGFT